MDNKVSAERLREHEELVSLLAYFEVQPGVTGSEHWQGVVKRAIAALRSQQESQSNELPKGAVSVVKPKGTEETGNDRPAAPICKWCYGRGYVSGGSPLHHMGTYSEPCPVCVAIQQESPSEDDDGWSDPCGQAMKPHAQRMLRELIDSATPPAKACEHCEHGHICFDRYGGDWMQCPLCNPSQPKSAAIQTRGRKERCPHGVHPDNRCAKCD